MHSTESAHPTCPTKCHTAPATACMGCIGLGRSAWRLHACGPEGRRLGPLPMPPMHPCTPCAIHLIAHLLVPAACCRSTDEFIAPGVTQFPASALYASRLLLTLNEQSSRASQQRRCGVEGLSWGAGTWKRLYTADKGRQTPLRVWNLPVCRSSRQGGLARCMAGSGCVSNRGPSLAASVAGSWCCCRRLQCRAVALENAHESKPAAGGGRRAGGAGGPRPGPLHASSRRSACSLCRRR